MVSWMVGNPGVRQFSSFRLMRGSIARAAASVSTHDTYFDVVLSWFTNRVGSLILHLVDLRARPRARAATTLAPCFATLARMLISSEIKPLRIGRRSGWPRCRQRAPGDLRSLFLKILHPESIQVRGWTSLILAIAFFGGLASLLIGIALEYLSALLVHAHGRPTFFVIDRSKDRLLGLSGRKVRREMILLTDLGDRTRLLVRSPCSERACSGRPS